MLRYTRYARCTSQTHNTDGYVVYVFPEMHKRKFKVGVVVSERLCGGGKYGQDDS